MPMDADALFLPAAGLSALLAAFAELGLDRAALDAALGTPVPADPTVRVPATLFEKAWAEAARQHGADDLALRAGLAAPFGAFGLVDYLCGSAATVAGGFESLVTHFRLVSTDNRVEVETVGDLRRVSVRPLVPMDAYVDEFTLAVLVGRFRRLTGGRFRPSRLLLRGPLADASARTTLLGCPVVGGQPVSAFEVPASHWTLPVDTADPFLHGTLVRLASTLPTSTSGEAPIENALRARLRDALADGDADIARMARLMGLSTRTLQRRLAETGRPYVTVVDDFRREEAARLLADPDLPLGRVAERLGYGEQASFSRAFVRWYGTAPGKWRADAHLRTAPRRDASGPPGSIPTSSR